MRVTFLGLGEAASDLARSLTNQGLELVAFDQANPKNPAVPLLATLELAVQNADVVISLNSASGSIRAAELAANLLKPGALFCDLNTSTPFLKRRLAEILPPESFVDGSLLQTPGEAHNQFDLAVSGIGASKFADIFSSTNLNINYVSDVAGEAAARGLIRSIFEQGIAAVLTDTLWAAKSLGLHEWAFDEIKREFDTSSSQTAQRYLDDTQQHPKRHSVQMADVVEMLSEAGHESTMVRGVELTLSRVIHGVRIPFAELD